MVNGEGNGPYYAAFLRETGFRVTEVRDWPENNDVIRDYHAVILSLRKTQSAPMIAARLRAKPHFGQRLLIALVDPDVTAHERRMALEAGFDEIVSDDGDCRLLVARLLRRLRAKPELRCVLPPPAKRRSAA
jgi:DNA-binding response OmpR family regulator